MQNSKLKLVILQNFLFLIYLMKIFDVGYRVYFVSQTVPKLVCIVSE